MRYRELTLSLLKHLAASGPVILDLLLPPHPKSRLARALIGLDGHRHSRSRTAAKHTLSSTLYRLRKEGLITKTGSKRKSRWAITSEGETFLQDASQRKPALQRLRYETLPPRDKIIRLVSFDIPEKQRKKRNWLRNELLRCEYRMLHRSVFIGNRPLPATLIQEITALNLMRCLQIVSVDRKGTLLYDA